MTFFVDRSLGSRQVPAALRAAGHEVVAHDEVFGPDEGDEVWLRRAGEEGWIVLIKDDRIRYRQHEREALVEAGVQAFVLTNGEALRASLSSRHDSDPGALPTRDVAIS